MGWNVNGEEGVVCRCFWNKQGRKGKEKGSRHSLRGGGVNLGFEKWWFAAFNRSVCSSRVVADKRDRNESFLNADLMLDSLRAERGSAVLVLVLVVGPYRR